MEELSKTKEQIMNEEQESYYRRLRKTCNEVRIDGKDTRYKIFI